MEGDGVRHRGWLWIAVVVAYCQDILAVFDIAAGCGLLLFVVACGQDILGRIPFRTCSPAFCIRSA